MKLKYIGPLEAVEVPHADGSIVVERGQIEEFPADIAKGLLEQGQDSAEENPQHQPQWVKASAKEAADSEKAAEGGDE